jgi:hypothetical protein
VKEKRKERRKKREERNGKRGSWKKNSKVRKESE